MAANYKLAFGVSTDDQGFRNSKTSINRFPDPSIITREIIQNALDANETGIVEVAFEIGQLSLKELPGMDEYREAFAAAQERERPNEEDKIAKIEECLQESKVPVLWVTDNGKGLDSENMRRILADGGSEKKGMAGSYGVGHLSVFSSSDLNYVIYGGCSKSQENGDEQILSGQCILASHVKDGRMLSPNGYICVPSSNEDPRERQFPQFADLKSGIWKDKLQQIGKKGTGSFICITAFNGFHSKSRRAPEEDILYAAASNFMPAIFEKKMSITVGNTLLNTDNLEEILSSRKDEKIRKRGVLFGAPGNAFYNLYTCMDNNSMEFEVPVLDNEIVRVRLDLAPEEGSRNIHLYRHGMWITDSVPEFRPAEFSSFKPFTAIILVDREKAEKTGALITKAEGERHMQIRTDHLNEKDEKKLRAVLKTIKEEIKKRVPQSGGNKISLPYIPFGPRTFKIERRTRSFSQRDASSKEEDSSTDSSSNRTNKEAVPGSNAYQRNAKPIIDIPCTTPVVEGNLLRFIARAAKRHRDVEVRAVNPSGSDDTCNSPVFDALVYLMPDGEVNGSKVPGKDYVPAIKDEEKDYVAFQLKTLNKGESEFVLKMAPTPPPSGAVYRIEFLKRKERK